MTRKRAPLRAWLSPVFMTLAALAVVVRVLIPQGFMLSAASEGHPVEIVLCSGKSMTVDDAASKSAPGHAPDKAEHQEACPFAGHGLEGPPPHLVEAQAIAFVAYKAAEPTPAQDRPQLQPVGPPLPARGPPVRLL